MFYIHILVVEPGVPREYTKPRWAIHVWPIVIIIFFSLMQTVKNEYLVMILILLTSDVLPRNTALMGHLNSSSLQELRSKVSVIGVFSEFKIIYRTTISKN